MSDLFDPLARAGDALASADAHLDGYFDALETGEGQPAQIAALAQAVTHLHGALAHLVMAARQPSEVAHA